MKKLIDRIDLSWIEPVPANACKVERILSQDENGTWEDLTDYGTVIGVYLAEHYAGYPALEDKTFDAVIEKITKYAESKERAGEVFWFWLLPR